MDYPKNSDTRVEIKGLSKWGSIFGVREFYKTTPTYADDVVPLK